MIKTVRKIGDSLGVTLPTKDVRHYLGLGEGDPVSVVIEKGEIKLVPLVRKPLIDETRRKAARLITKNARAIDLLREK